MGRVKNEPLPIEDMAMVTVIPARDAAGDRFCCDARIFRCRDEAWSVMGATARPCAAGGA